MTTAVLEKPEVEPIDETMLAETFAKQHAIDGAVRRKVARQQTANDEMILSMYGIEGQKLQTEMERIAGVDHRRRLAAKPKEYSAAMRRKDKSVSAMQAANKTIVPKISKLEEELRALRSELSTIQDEQRQAAAALAMMDNSRAMLRDKLLPESFKSMLAAMTRPIRDKYRQSLATARQNHSQLHGAVQAGLGGASPGQAQDAEHAVQALQAALEDECLKCGDEIRSFYIPD